MSVALSAGYERCLTVPGTHHTADNATLIRPTNDDSGLTDHEQRLSELDSLAVLAAAAAALLNVRCAYVSRRRNGQSSGK